MILSKCALKFGVNWPHSVSGWWRCPQSNPGHPSTRMRKNQFRVCVRSSPGDLPPRAPITISSKTLCLSHKKCWFFNVVHCRCPGPTNLYHPLANVVGYRHLFQDPTLIITLSSYFLNALLFIRILCALKLWNNKYSGCLKFHLRFYKDM